MRRARARPALSEGVPTVFMLSSARPSNRYGQRTAPYAAPSRPGGSRRSRRRSRRGGRTESPADSSGRPRQYAGSRRHIGNRAYSAPARNRRRFRAGAQNPVGYVAGQDVRGLQLALHNPVGAHGGVRRQEMQMRCSCGSYPESTVVRGCYLKAPLNVRFEIRNMHYIA